MVTFLLCGCGAEKHGRISQTDPSGISSPQAAENDVLEYKTCSFSDGLDRFVECYNTCCEAYGNTNLLKADAGWHFSNDCWHYRQYENNWLEPEMQVYVEGSDSIREIRIGFEDHGYTEWGEALSIERSFYTLRCLCETLDDEELRQLIADIISDMKKATNYVELGESPIITNPVCCDDYELYHFFSGGIYYLCITKGQ